MPHDKEMYKTFREHVWIRDYGYFVKTRKLATDGAWQRACRFFRCLTHEEQERFLTLWKDRLQECRNIDVTHILSKSTHPDKKYDPNNAVLMNNLSHSMIDSYRSPLTGEEITKEERDLWFDRILQEGKKR